jgi:hypothetical protein
MIQQVLKTLVDVILHENVELNEKGNLYGSIESLLLVLAFSVPENNTQAVRKELA